MTAAKPLYFRWDGDAMIPLNPRAANRQYVVEERYRLTIEEERSSNSHRHFFAAVNEAFKQLPEGLAEQFQSADALRKRALIDAGFYDEEIIDCGSPEVAATVATFARKHDDFAMVYIADHLVVIRSAKSQSVKAMGKEDFQRSKQAVLEILAEMVGVSADALQEHAGAAA